jgi:tetratricopeptide (TPR) repeat protein
MRITGHLRTMAVGAVAMTVLGIATRWPPYWESRTYYLGVGMWAAGGACGGLLLSISHPLLRRGGFIVEWFVVASVAFVTLATVAYLNPFVWQSFFRPRASPYGQYVIPSALFGLVATWDLRRRARRLREWFPGHEGGARDLGSWLGSRPLHQQLGIAIGAVALILASLDLFPNTGMTFEEALAYSEERLGQNPDDPWALSYRAYMLVQAQDWEAALPIAERAVELEPEHPGPREVLAWAHLGVGNEEEALAHLTTAARADTRNARLWRDVARMAYMLQRRDEALAAYTHLTTIAPNSAVWLPEDRDAWNDLSSESR